nr:hypothetical protein CFP56_76578 [Quercus suber]
MFRMGTKGMEHGKEAEEKEVFVFVVGMVEMGGNEDFNEGTREEPWPYKDPGPNAQGQKSFRDKLVGEILGAFAEAFDLTDQMEEDPDSDDDEVDVGDLTRVGVVAMKLTKETKRRVRGPWSKAIIIKLVGRTIGLSYLRSKLIQLWKPSGRMDCVDLTYGFFFVRFYFKEDLDSVIKKGPWFIGDHFLFLRAWEPFFKPSAANVSLVAVWVRLNELPIELYEPELKQIGENIGKVLRIDSHTAMETRGSYARLCIQVDLNKPLINTVIIGRFEQGVTYEVRRKRNGSKGATPGKKLEGTSVHARNSPLPPGPKISGRTSTSQPGPTHKQSMACEDIHYSSEDQCKKGEAGRGLKFEGPTTSPSSGRSEYLHDGPLKFTAACHTIRPITSSSLGPELGISA